MTILINNGLETYDDEKITIHQRPDLPTILASLATVTQFGISSVNDFGSNTSSGDGSECDEGPVDDSTLEDNHKHKFLDIITLPIPLESAVHRNPHQQRAAGRSKDIVGSSRVANMSSSRRSIETMEDRTKRRSAMDHVREREQIHEDYHALFNNFYRSNKIDTSAVQAEMIKSEIHSAMVIPYLAGWLVFDKNNEEAQRYEFNEALDDLEQANLIKKIYLPGFGDFPIPVDLYDKVEYKLFPHWVDSQRSDCPLIDNRCTLNEVVPAGAHSMVGKKVESIVQRVQSMFGISSRECTEVQDYVVPKRFHDNARFENSYKVVQAGAYLAPLTEEQAEVQHMTDPDISNSGLIKKKWYEDNFLLNVHDRQSNFFTPQSLRTAYDDSDRNDERSVLVRSHDLFGCDERRTHGSRQTAINAVYHLLMESADLACKDRTKREYDEINDQMHRIRTEALIEAAKKEQDRTVITQQEEEDLANGIQADTELQDRIHKMDPF